MRHELRTSWSRNLVLFLISVGFVVVSCAVVWTGVTDDDVPVLLVPFGVIGAVFFGICGLGWFLRGLRFGPVVVIDSAGVFDRRVMSEPAPWSEIQEIGGVTVQRAVFIGLTVDRPDRFIKRLSAFSEWIRGLNKRNFLYDFQIGFTELSADSGEFLEVAAQTGQPIAIAAYEEYLEARRADAVVDQQRVELAPRARFWARLKLVCSATGALACLIIAYFAALQIIFDPTDDDWVTVVGVVDGVDNIVRIAGDTEDNDLRHAGIFIVGEKVRFVVKGDDPGYGAFVARPWLGQSVTIRLYKNDLVRATREIDQHSPDGAEFSRQQKLEKFETRIWEMHAKGREVVNLDARVQDEKDGWPLRLFVTLAFIGVTCWLVLVVRRNWRRMRGRPI